jgi:hypothetical protein
MGDAIFGIEEQAPEFLLIKSLEGRKNVPHQVFCRIIRGADEYVFSDLSHKATHASFWLFMTHEP